MTTGKLTKITISLTQAQADAIRAAAVKECISVSAWIRRAAVKEVSK